MSTERDNTSTDDYAPAKPLRRTRDDSYTALREAAERRRVQNRIAQRNSRRRNYERKAKTADSMKQQEENQASSEMTQNQRDDISTNSNSEADTNHTAGSSISSNTGGTGAKGDGQNSDMGPSRDNDGHIQTAWPMAYISAMHDSQASIAPPMLFQNDRNCIPYQQEGFSHFPTPPEDMCQPSLDFPLQHHDLLSMPLHDANGAGMLPNHPMSLSSEVASPFQAATRRNLLQTHDMMSNESLPWMADGGMSKTMPRSNNNNNNSNISARLQIVLDCIQSAGFPNFDELATTYYTAKFDGNSAADTEQKISRSRRLRDFLASLRQNSKRWTRWESRGYDREIIESAEEMYVDELQKMITCLDGNEVLSHSRSESDHNPSASEISNDSSLMDMMMTNEETSHSKGIEVALDTARYYQNKLPNIWALLMELAGHNGSQSELAVVTAVSILYHSRKNPELKFLDFIHLMTHGLLEIPN